MIEETIRSFLAARLDVPVRLSVPTPAPARFVVVEKTGSGYEDGIYSATIAVQSYGPAATSHDGTLDAAKLNELVKAAMQDADNLPQLVRCDLYSTTISPTPPENDPAIRPFSAWCITDRKEPFLWQMQRT